MTVVPNLKEPKKNLKNMSINFTFSSYYHPQANPAKRFHYKFWKCNFILPGLLFLPQGNAITNFFQGGNSNRPPSASGDEGAAPAQPSNTNIIHNIQNAIQNSPLNPFRPQGGTNEQNPIQNGKTNFFW